MLNIMSREVSNQNISQALQCYLVMDNHSDILSHDHEANRDLGIFVVVLCA